jgi:hypothetical protein
LCIELIELTDVLENRRELIAHALAFFLGQSKTGESRNVIDIGECEGHKFEILVKTTIRRTRAPSKESSTATWVTGRMMRGNSAID